ncbi:MAG: cytochrome c, partial [Myxococcota bacterium]
MLSLWALSIGTALATDNAKRPTDEQRGKELYERHCVSCHGAKAAGDGPATSALVFEVPDLQGKVKSDRATIDLVVLGKGTMPAFEASFESDDARRVLQYMATVHT